MKLTKITQTGNKSSIEVSDDLFISPPNAVLVAQAVRVFLVNQRKAHAKTKTRSAVKLTKAKWYRQKGTGNARHGSKNAPIFVGGGSAHGPKGVENYRLSLNKKQKQVALRSALTLNKDALIVSDLPLTLRKTKDAHKFVQLVTDKKAEQKMLLVIGQAELKTRLAFQNLPNTLIETPEKVNTYQVAIAQKICFSTEAIKKLAERLKVDKVVEKDKK